MRLHLILELLIFQIRKWIAVSRDLRTDGRENNYLVNNYLSNFDSMIDFYGRRKRKRMANPGLIPLLSSQK